MSGWLEIRAGGRRRRYALRPGLIRIGGEDADIPLPDAGRGELHLLDDPPRVVRIQGPRLDSGGAATDELPLSDGTRFRWAGAELCYARAAPVLEEIPLDEEPLRRPEPSLGAGELRAWRRVQAGLLAELGRADPGVVRRWQDAVKDSRFDPDACSAELLRETSFDPDDSLLVDRSAGLLRDLLMAPLLRGARGAGRRARGAAKSGLAFLIAQVVVMSVYSLLIAVLLVLVRAKWDVSVDGLIDALLGTG